MDVDHVKIGAVVAVNCDKENIWYCLKGIYDFCDKVVVVYSDTTWTGIKQEDGTLEIVENFEDRDNKLYLIKGTFTTQHGQRTAGLKYLKNKGYHFVFVVDSDEVYHPTNLVRARDFVDKYPETLVFSVEWVQMWKTLQYRLLPCRTIKVFFRIRDDFRFPGPSRQFRYRRRRIPIKIIPEVYCCHLTCVCSNEYMLEKLQTRTYRNIVVPNWYEEKWLKWHPGIKNLHPTKPDVYEQAVPFDQTKLPSFLKSHKLFR